MDDRFLCALCLDRFTDPRILPCAHTFCRDCLESYLTKKVGSTRPKTKYDCPLCRETNILPPGGVGGVKKNFYLEEMVKPGYPSCEVHPKEDLRFYCNVCKKAVCRDCKIVSHEGHETDMIDNVAAVMKTKLNEQLNSAEISINVSEMEVRQNLEQGLNKIEITTSVVNKLAERMKTEIDSLVHFINCSVQPHCEKRKTTIYAIQANFDAKRAKLSAYEKSLAQASENNDSATVLELFEKLINQNEIKKKEDTVSMLKCESDDTGPNENKLRSFYLRLSELMRFTEHCSTRLGMLMGPDHINICWSDPHLQIREMYSEMYDNEWTDAYCVIMDRDAKQKEKDIIQRLLEMLMNANTFCQHEAKLHTKLEFRSIMQTDKVGHDTSNIFQNLRLSYVNSKADKVYEVQL